MFRKSVSILLSFLMILGAVIVAPSAAAEEQTTPAPEAGLSDSGLAMTSSNSLGDMLVDEYEESQQEKMNESDNPGGVFGVEVVGKTARADVRALADALLVVSIFDEEGKLMLGSGRQEVTPEDTVVELTLDIDEMPPYFLVRAFLLDKLTNLPVSKPYENDYYTQEMQEFFAKTTDDFDEDKILNLDNSEEENFLVYNDDTIIIENDDENTNIVTQADDETKEYVIENIDEKIAALQVGDIISYDPDGDTLLIIKISSITIDGTTATITGDELKLADAFAYIRIDASEGLSEGSVDNSEIDDSIEFAGYEDDDLAPTGAQSELADTGVTMIDEKGAAGVSLKYTFKEINSGGGDDAPLNAKITGSISCKFDAEVSIYYDESFHSRDIKFSFALKYELGLSVGFEISATLKIPLGKAIIPVVPGAVSVTFTPSFIVEGKISGNLTGKLEGQYGFTLSNGTFAEIEKPARATFEVKLTAEVFIGLSLEPAVELACGVVKAKASFRVGVKISAEMTGSATTNPDEEHMCAYCIDGTISKVVEGSVSLIFFNSEKLEFKATFLKWEKKLFDFYWSLDNHQFGKGDCPNRSYKITVMVLDENCKPVKDVYVNRSKYTDSTGQAYFFMKPGYNEITLQKGDRNGAVYVNVSGPKRVKVTMTADGFDAGGSYNSVSVEPMNSSPEKDSGKIGKEVNWSLRENGSLYIFGKGDMLDNYINGSNDWGRDIKKVFVLDGVTGVCRYAFDKCEKLNTVYLAASVKSIGDHAFEGCIAFDSICLPDALTFIDENAFCGCTGLQSIEIPDSVTKIDTSAFSGCTGLKSVILPSKLYELGAWSFGYCTGLTEIVIPDSLRSFWSEPFIDCSGLTEVTIPEVVANNFRSFFSGVARNIKTVHLSDSVSRINQASFYECTGLEQIDIPDTVTSIENQAFRGCTGLTQIKLPNALTFIGNDAFIGCTGLQSIEIPDSVTKIDTSAFSGCTGLKSVTLPSNLDVLGAWSFGYCTGLTEIVVPDSLRSFWSEPFKDCSGLTEVTIPQVVANNFRSFFSGATENIKTVHLSDSVSRINQASFYDCTGLEQIDIPDAVTSIENQAFRGCTGLMQIKLPDALTFIGENAFSGCTGLQSIDIPDSVTKINTSAFSGCTGLKSVTLPSALDVLGAWSFGYCTGLTKIVIPDSLRSFSNGPFEECSGLTEVTIPQVVANNYRSFFSGVAAKIKTVHLSDSVSRINQASFYECTGLEQIDIPVAVTAIEERAFYNCDHLSDVYYGGTQEQWNEISIKSDNTCLTSATIHYNSLAPTGAAPVSLIGTQEESLDTEMHTAALSATGADNIEQDPTEPESSLCIREHLVPGTEATLVILSGGSSLHTADLLYIAQQTVEKNGTVSFTAYGDYSGEDVAFLIFGECSHSPSEWVVIKEPDTDGYGLRTQFCQYCDAVLGAETLILHRLGDVDGDGEIGVIDATIIQRYEIGIPVPVSEEDIRLCGDIDRNGDVEITDATLIQRHIAEIAISYPIGEPINE